MDHLAHSRRIFFSLTPGAAGELPTEFRIFKAGLNCTSKGDSIFDDEAARSVMAEYKLAGVQQMIDLEHEALEENAPRADSRDARAWYDLEVRPGPELWAVNVSWTPDGARRLVERTQRYISPAFWVHKESGRIMALDNCALCARPATHGAPPLVASRLRGSGSRATVRLSASDRALISTLTSKLKMRRKA